MTARGPHRPMQRLGRESPLLVPPNASKVQGATIASQRGSKQSPRNCRFPHLQRLMITFAEYMTRCVDGITSFPFLHDADQSRLMSYLLGVKKSAHHRQKSGALRSGLGAQPSRIWIWVAVAGLTAAGEVACMHANNAPESVPPSSRNSGKGLPAPCWT